MSWNGPESLGSEVTEISAVSWQPNRLDVFAVLAAIAPLSLQHWWYPDPRWGTNQQPESLGGSLSIALSAVSWNANRLDIFATGSDETLQHWWFDNGWGNNKQPEPLGGYPLSGVNSSLSAVSWAPGRLDVFGVDARDRTLQHWWYPDPGWRTNQQPESLGGNLGAPVSAVSWQPGRLDIFGMGPGQTLQHWWYPGPSWGTNQQPESLGGVLEGTALSAVSWQPNRLDIFGVNPDSTLQHWWYDNGWGANKLPESLGGRLSASVLSVVSYQPGRLDIFGVDASDRTLQHWWVNDNGWGNSARPESLGGNISPGAGLSAVSWAPGRLDVFGVDANDQSLQHWWYV